MMRSVLLHLSKNQWMRTRVPRWKFVRRAVRRFMPGETLEAALDAAAEFEREGIPAVFTGLGENITDLEQARRIRDHYLDAINRIGERGLDVELSVKPTQLGLDLSADTAFEYCREIACKIKNRLGNELFLDMESSAYVRRTLDLYFRLKEEWENTGLCIQAYLHRTQTDIDELFRINASLRLVKGAYKEPPDTAIKSKKKVDENFFALARKSLNRTKLHGSRIIYATHDEKLIARIIEEAREIGLERGLLEFQMLYGVKTSLQRQLAREGYKVRVLIAYGESWFPWYMRRLAERPANLGFVLRNVILRN
jgi:proline dehydrogenase